MKLEVNVENGKGLLALIYNAGLAVGKFLQRYGHKPDFIRINPATLEAWGEGKITGNIGGIPIIEDESMRPEAIEVQ